MAEASMRLDRFLWHARLAKTRSAAQAMACAGRLRLDGRPIDRAAAAVRVGSILTFMAGPHVRIVRVEALPMRRGPPAEARGCYQELAPGAAEREGCERLAANAAMIDEAGRRA